MTWRGSLKQCVAKCIDWYAKTDAHVLAILRCPRGKYYTAVTAVELVEEENKALRTDHQLVFHGTKAELMAFVESDQSDLFDGPQQEYDAKAVN